jgi:hypothetical protein
MHLFFKRQVNILGYALGYALDSRGKIILLENPGNQTVAPEIIAIPVFIVGNDQLVMLNK